MKSDLRYDALPSYRPSSISDQLINASLFSSMNASYIPVAAYLLICFCNFRLVAPQKVQLQYNDLPFISILKLPSVDWTNLERRAKLFLSIYSLKERIQNDNDHHKNTNKNAAQPLPLVPSSVFDDFEHEILFYVFLKNFYNRTITTIESTSKSSSDIINRNVIHFIPTNPTNRNYTLEHWKKLDNEISTYMNTSTNNFILNRAFLVSTRPSSTIVLKGVRSGCRNIMDMYHLRLVNDLAVSDRNIVIPFYDQSTERSIVDGKSKITLDQKRKNLVFFAGTVMCNHNATMSTSQDGLASSMTSKEGILLSESRSFIQLLLSFWKQYQGKYKQESNIIELISQREWDDNIRNSDFCFILPPATPSNDTIKISKSTKRSFLLGSSPQNLFLILSNECIPVLFVASYDQLPLTSVLKWSEFAVVAYQDILYSSDKMTALLHYLKSLDVGRYRSNIVRVKRLFDYHNFEWPSIYHLSLLEMAQYMNQGEEFLTWL